MRVLFCLNNAGNLRLYESVLRALAERGNEVRLLFARPGERRAERESEALLAELVDRRGIVLAPAPPDTGRPAPGGHAMRSWQDHLRYMDPPLAEAAVLRARAASRTPRDIVRLDEMLAGEPGLAALLRRLLAIGERAEEPPDALVEYVRREAPDVVFVSTLLGRPPVQLHLLRAARSLGLPVVYGVASWDNLTTTTMVYDVPDATLVWNEEQRREAIELHDLSPETVAVTGAPVYDAWFEAEPARDHDAWCRACGLEPGRPYLLYACSTSLLAPREAHRIITWLERLRAHEDATLCQAQILVRPHPQYPLAGPDGEEQAAFDRLRSMEGVAVHPLEGALPVTTPTRSDYADALRHAAAITGVNTSAMVEGAIFGKGVHVLLDDTHHATGTVHFGHLLGAGGGLVQATTDVARHHRALARALRGEDREEATARARAFVGAFIRPAGVDRSVAPEYAAAIEAAAAHGVRAPAEPGLTVQRAHAEAAQLWTDARKRGRRPPVDERIAQLRRFARQLPARTLRKGFEGTAFELFERRPGHDYVPPYFAERARRVSAPGDDPGFAARVEAAQGSKLGEAQLATLDRAVVEVARRWPSGELRVADLGVFRGGSAEFLARAVRDHAPERRARVIAVDTFTGHDPVDLPDGDDGIHRAGRYNKVDVTEVRERLAAHRHVEVVEGRIQDVAEQLPRRLHFVHIDFEIGVPTAFALALAAQRLAVGGLVVLNDVGSRRSPGVDAALRSFLAGEHARDFTVVQMDTGQAVLTRVSRR